MDNHAEKPTKRKSWVPGAVSASLFMVSGIGAYIGGNIFTTSEPGFKHLEQSAAGQTYLSLRSTIFMMNVLDLDSENRFFRFREAALASAFYKKPDDFNYYLRQIDHMYQNDSQIKSSLRSQESIGFFYQSLASYADRKMMADTDAAFKSLLSPENYTMALKHALGKNQAATDYLLQEKRAAEKLDDKQKAEILYRALFSKDYKSADTLVTAGANLEDVHTQLLAKTGDGKDLFIWMKSKNMDIQTPTFGTSIEAAAIGDQPLLEFLLKDSHDEQIALDRALNVVVTGNDAALQNKIGIYLLEKGADPAVISPADLETLAEINPSFHKTLKAYKEPAQTPNAQPIEPRPTI